MSNFYGGKQGFSFFIAKTYTLIHKYIEFKEKWIYQEQESDTSDEGAVYNSVEEFLSERFSTDTDVHYNDYILISVGIGNFDFHSTSPYHGNLYRKDITEFKLVGNLAGPPGGASQVIPLSWDNFTTEYLKDKANQSYGNTVSPIEEGGTEISANIVSGKTESKVLFRYYTYEDNNKTILKLATQIPAPYFDFSEYDPSEKGVAPTVNPLFLNESGEDTRTNLFYNNYEYPLVTKYYKPRIDNDELYGELYEYTVNEDGENYSYKATNGKTIYLGKIKQESGILIGKNVSYYILNSEAGSQTDSDLQQYLDNKEKRDTLLTVALNGYILLTNKKVICKKLNDDYPCGLGYVYAKQIDSKNDDKTKREANDIDLIGKIITYGDENGPIVNDKVTTWFFGYDFSRKQVSLEIIPDWYYLNLYAVETKIVYAEDQGSGTNIIPATSQEIKVGDLWVGLSDSRWKETL